jgi:short-subunit dehydrogenase
MVVGEGMELRPSSSYRTALVTGASRGLGRAMAEELARAGTTVAMISRGREQLDEVAANIRRSGGVARTFAVDVGDTEAAVQVT